MGHVASIFAVLVLVSSLMTGCGCLAADSYSKPACQKYDTTGWHDPAPFHHGSE
jgi:hypothetical protein